MEERRLLTVKGRSRMCAQVDLRDVATMMQAVALSPVFDALAAVQDRHARRDPSHMHMHMPDRSQKSRV